MGWAACWQTAAVPPLWPWQQVLAQLAGADRPLPDLSSTEPDPDVAQGAQADRVIEWLRGGGRRLQVIVLEDLHWADTATLWLLQRLAAVLPGMRVLVVATTRSLTAGSSAAIAEALSSLRRLALPVDLYGLPVEDASDLVAAVAGTAPSSGVARSLRDLTGGNPLFLRELSRSLTPAQLQASGLPAIGIPPSLQTLVTDRVVALAARPPQTRTGTR